MYLTLQTSSTHSTRSVHLTLQTLVTHSLRSVHLTLQTSVAPWGMLRAVRVEKGARLCVAQPWLSRKC